MKLVITLDDATTEKYLALAGARVEADTNADCEPSGITLTVNIESTVFPSTIWLGSVELGEVEVALVE